MAVSLPVGATPTAAGRVPWSPSTWPAWLGIAVLAALVRLPDAWQARLGTLIGRMLQLVLWPRRRIAARNLALCFPELDESARATLLRASFVSVGRGVIEFARAWWGDVSSLRPLSTVEGVETLKRLKAEGRGVLLLSGHFLTLEICGRLLCDQVEVAGMYRPHDSRALEWAVRAGRLRYARAMYTNDQVRPAIRHLKAGGVLWYAPDHAYRRGAHVYAQFFGLSALTLTATHELARLTGAAVVPFHHRRNAAGGYTIRIGEPLADFPSADVVADCSRINALIEGMVRAAPDEYLWLHKRFKHPPEGVADPYRTTPG